MSRKKFYYTTGWSPTFRGLAARLQLLRRCRSEKFLRRGTAKRSTQGLCDALVWREITGTNPPHTPITAREYGRAGFPWFDFYRDDVAVLEGSKTLAGVKSVVQISKEKGDMAGVGNDSVESESPVHCGPKKRSQEVREWDGP